MWAKPRPQQRPKAFHRIDVQFMKAVAVVISGVIATAMTDRLMHIAPLFQAAIDVIFIGVDTSARRNHRFDQGLDRHVLDIFQHPNDRLTTPLDHPENRWFLCCKRASSPLALEPSASSTPPLFATASGFPLWPATM